MSASDSPWNETWSPVVGCIKVSPGYEHCRLRRFARLPDALSLPFYWRTPRRVSVAAMSDLFGDGVPDDYIAAVFGVMAANPDHQFYVSTKYSARMVKWFAWVEAASRDFFGGAEGEESNFCLSAKYDMGKHLDMAICPTCRGWCRVASDTFAPEWPLRNVCLGVSVESAAFLSRIDNLRRCPAAVRWVSCEPLLGLPDLRPYLGEGGIDWVVVGGEFGPEARACTIANVESVLRQCADASVPAFVTQLGRRPRFGGRGPCWTDDQGEHPITDPKGADMAEWPEHLRVREYPRRTE